MGHYLPPPSVAVGVMVHLSGYMDKLSKDKRQRRSAYLTFYVLLRGSTLFWFSRRSDLTHAGSVLLRDKEIVLSDNVGEFVVLTPRKKLTFKLSTNIQREEWVNAMIAAGARAPLHWKVKEEKTKSRGTRYRSRSSPVSGPVIMLSPHRAEEPPHASAHKSNTDQLCAGNL